ncbi:MAG: hypothetical protein E3J72_22335 [Planctomycetota bacterium]|nr:MAG: hypothetical protein E3J72_22335 [Planctomycetota bacterium]
MQRREHNLRFIFTITRWPALYVAVFFAAFMICTLTIDFKSHETGEMEPGMRAFYYSLAAAFLITTAIWRFFVSGNIVVTEKGISVKGVGFGWEQIKGVLHDREKGLKEIILFYYLDGNRRLKRQVIKANYTGFDELARAMLNEMYDRDRASFVYSGTGISAISQIAQVAIALFMPLIFAATAGDNKSKERKTRIEGFRKTVMRRMHKGGRIGNSKG